MLSLFLSHHAGPRDVPLVTALAAALPQYGISPFIAEHHRKPGHPITDKVRSALDASEIVLVLFTKDGQASAAVNQEVGYATKAGKFVIPLVEKGVKPTMFMYGIEPIEYDPENPIVGLAEAVNALNAIHAKKQDELRKALEAQKKRDDLIAFLGVMALLILAIALVVALARGKGGASVAALPAGPA